MVEARKRGDMRNVGIMMARGARAVWWWLRQVMGDAAYENYLRSAGRRNGAHDAGKASCKSLGEPAPLLTREEFYLDALRRRYSRASRCC
jgi:hypothetical protein